jgi:hypothetical protein
VYIDVYIYIDEDGNRKMGSKVVRRIYCVFLLLLLFAGRMTQIFRKLPGQRTVRIFSLCFFFASSMVKWRFFDGVDLSIGGIMQAINR